MNVHESVTEEEMRALLPHYEIEASYMRRIKRRIIFRTILVAILLGIRAITAAFFPELLFKTTSDENFIDASNIGDLALARAVMLSIIGSVYIYSLWTNRYFRTVSVLGLIVSCSLLWADLEIYIFASIGNMTPAAIMLLMTRVVALNLLFLNYLDIRR